MAISIGQFISVLENILLTLLVVVPQMEWIQAADAHASEVRAVPSIEDVVKNSKGVDKSRPVNAVLTKEMLSISTYCDPRASDQDCKINAMFVMKDLLQHYKTIHRMHISFFNPTNANQFRSLDITDDDVALVDGGRPVQDVLSQIEISAGALAPPPVANVPLPSGSTQSSALNSSSSSSNLAKSSGALASSGSSQKLSSDKFAYKNYGLTVNYPNVWKVEYPRTGNILIRLFPPSQSKQTSIIDLKMYPTGQTAASVAQKNPESLFLTLWEIAFTQSMPDLMGGLSSMLNFHRSAQGFPARHQGYGRQVVGHQLPVRFTGVQIPATLKLGQGKSLEGYQRAYWATTPMSPRSYLRAVSFSNSQYVFQLLLLAPESESATANGEFELLLADLKLAACAKSNSHILSSR